MANPSNSFQHFVYDNTCKIYKNTLKCYRRDLCEFDFVVTFQMFQNPNFVYIRVYKTFLIPTM